MPTKAHDLRALAARWLRQAREDAGYKSGEFATAIGAHQTSLSNYETGKSAVPEERVDAIARALRMSVIDVRRGLRMWVPEGLEPRIVTPEEAIINDGRLSGDQQRVLLGVLEIMLAEPRARPRLGDYDPDEPPPTAGPRSSGRRPGASHGPRPTAQRL